MSLNVRIEVIRDQVVVSMICDATAQCREAVGVSKHASLDRVEDLCKVWIELEIAKVMSVAEILNVFCEVTKKEDIGLANFTGDLDLQILGQH